MYRWVYTNYDGVDMVIRADSKKAAQNAVYCHEKKRTGSVAAAETVVRTIRRY